MLLIHCEVPTTSTLWRRISDVRSPARLEFFEFIANEMGRDMIETSMQGFVIGRRIVYFRMEPGAWIFELRSIGWSLYEIGALRRAITSVIGGYLKLEGVYGKMETKITL